MARIASGMWKLGGLRRRALAREVWHHCIRDEVLGRSGELAYFFLLSVFPLLLVLVAILGQAVDEGSALRSALFEYLRVAIPDSDSFILVRDTISEVGPAIGGKLSIGILLAVWASSRGVEAIARGLSTAYETRYVRPLWARKAVSLALALAFAVLAAAGLAIVFYGGAITRAIAGRLYYGGSALLGAWSWLQRPLAILFVLFAFDLLYNFAAGGLRRRGVRWLTPGAVVGVAVWLGASLSLKLYLSHFGVYTRVYGSLGAVIILLLWFYLIGLAVLVGGQVNAAIMRAENGQSKSTHEMRTNRSLRRNPV